MMEGRDLELASIPRYTERVGLRQPLCHLPRSAFRAALASDRGGAGMGQAADGVGVVREAA
jgi:hypothetical protein